MSRRFGSSSLAGESMTHAWHHGFSQTLPGTAYRAKRAGPARQQRLCTGTAGSGLYTLTTAGPQYGLSAPPLSQKFRLLWSVSPSPHKVSEDTWKPLQARLTLLMSSAGEEQWRSIPSWAGCTAEKSDLPPPPLVSTSDIIVSGVVTGKAPDVWWHRAAISFKSRQSFSHKTRYQMQLWAINCKKHEISVIKNTILGPFSMLSSVKVGYNCPLKCVNVIQLTSLRVKHFSPRCWKHIKIIKC